MEDPGSAPPPDRQLDFDFDNADGRQDGYRSWQEDRRKALHAMARKLGLPLGHPCEVNLRDGTCLRGLLALASDELWIEPRRDFHLELRIDRCTFAAADIESCIRMD